MEPHPTCVTCSHFSRWTRHNGLCTFIEGAYEVSSDFYCASHSDLPQSGCWGCTVAQPIPL